MKEVGLKKRRSRVRMPQLDFVESGLPKPVADLEVPPCKVARLDSVLAAQVTHSGNESAAVTTVPSCGSGAHLVTEVPPESSSSCMYRKRPLLEQAACLSFHSQREEYVGLP